VLNTNEILALRGGKDAVVDEIRINREEPLPGRVNRDSMVEWCVTHDEGSGKWVAYLQNEQSTVVTTASMELDCHGITTSDGVLHCLAEMSNWLDRHCKGAD